MILVTGDSGFIGRHLVAQLLKRGMAVRGIDIVPKPSESPNYPQVVGNILDHDAVVKAIGGVQCIIHLAAEHKDYGLTREKYYQVNEEGTKQLLRCASELGVKKFIFYSSVAVYGAQKNATEESLPLPNNDYGGSKLAAEKALADWAKADPTRSVVIVRPTVVFGPHSRANIFRLIAYVCEKRFIWVGNGRQIKSIAYVDNLVEATLFLLDRMKPSVDVYNYSDLPQMTTRELVALISQTAGVPEPKTRIPMGLALPAARVLDVVGEIMNHNFWVTTARLKKFNQSTIYEPAKIRTEGFNPPYSIRQGLDRNIKWYFEERKNGQAIQFERSGE